MINCFQKENNLLSLEEKVSSDQNFMYLSTKKNGKDRA